MTKQIGWYNLKEDKEYTNTFECAAWYENVLVKAGRYPVMVSDYQEVERKVTGHASSASVILPGVITSDEFGGRFCGMPISDYDQKKNAGQPGRHNLRPYIYSIAESIVKDPDTPWELLPEYEAREIRFISQINGEEIVSHGIFKKEAT